MAGSLCRKGKAMPIKEELIPNHMRGGEAAHAKARAFRESLSPEELHANAAARMEFVDALPKEMRSLVHEYGLTTVKSFMKHAAKLRLDYLNAKLIRKLIIQAQAKRDAASQ